MVQPEIYNFLKFSLISFAQVDMLPQSYGHSHIKSYTCLTLHLSDTIIHSPSDLHHVFITFITSHQLLQKRPNSKQLLASDIFVFDSTLQIIRICYTSIEIIRLPIIICNTRFVRFIKNKRVYICRKDITNFVDQ